MFEAALRSSRKFLPLVAGVLLIVLALVQERNEARSSAQELLFRMSKGPEARAWLAENQHPAALASNRFRSTAAALDFVDRLYALGAARVVVAPTAIRFEDDVEAEYADALIVRLAEDADARERVTDFLRAHSGLTSSEADVALDYGVVFLWWD